MKMTKERKIKGRTAHKYLKIGTDPISHHPGTRHSRSLRHCFIS
jgi:hypothetical protein